jgi:hypothetical protein
VSASITIAGVDSDIRGCFLVDRFFLSTTCE